MRRLLPMSVLLVCAGCAAAVPAQVAQLHQREAEIIGNLQASHLELIDAYIARKRSAFDSFFFDEYLPVYHGNWLEAFESERGRAFDAEQDFGLLAMDVVAEYQDLALPIDSARLALVAAVSAEYTNALAAHAQVGDWLASIEELTDAQRRNLDRLLGLVRPGLDLETIDTAVLRANQRVKDALAGFGVTLNR